jgi:hypothetical protein
LLQLISARDESEKYAQCLQMVKAKPGFVQRGSPLANGAEHYF